VVFIQLSILSLAFLLYMIYDEKTDGFFSKLSIPVNQFAEKNYRADLIYFNKSITRLGGVLFLAIAFVVLTVYFFVNGFLLNATLTAFAGLGGIGISELMKQTMKAPRPRNGLRNPKSHAFPSGHVTMSVLFYGLLMYIFKPGIVATVLLLLLIVLIAKSRVYLRVHWLSDVLAGFFLGFFWLNFILSFV